MEPDLEWDMKKIPLLLIVSAFSFAQDAEEKHVYPTECLDCSDVHGG
jgi:hypothetical protein